MDLEKDRRVRPPGTALFRFEGSVLKELLYDEEVILIQSGCTEIATAAFLNNLYIEKVVLHASVHTISDAAFSGCMYLHSVIMDEGLETVGEDAFYMSGLKWVSLPDSLRCIGKSAFQDTNMVSVRIPGGIKIIPDDCFADNWALETVWLHEGVSEIHSGAFRNCPKLKEVYCPSSLISIADDAFEETPVMTVVAPREWLLSRQDLVDKIMWKFK